MREIFNIDVVEQLAIGRWKVDGRAYEDVAVGATLTLRGSSGESIGRLTVAGVSTYGRETSGLARMMTGSLVLEGDDAGRLARATFLYGP
jgi:hypothetical protein